MQRHEHELLAVSLTQSSSRDFELTLSAAQQIVVARVCNQQAALFDPLLLQARKDRGTQRRQPFTGPRRYINRLRLFNTT